MDDEAEAVKEAASALLSRLPNCHECNARATRECKSYDGHYYVCEAHEAHVLAYHDAAHERDVDWRAEAAALEALCK